MSLEDLQREVVDLLEPMEIGDRIGACGRVLAWGAESVTAYGDDPDAARYLNGLCRCNNWKLCPVCAFRRQLAVRETMREAMAEHMDRGGWIYLLTLTIPHDDTWPLEELQDVLFDAWSYLKSGNQWQEWAERLDYVGAVRTYEVTHGRNGWHPHVHAPMFLASKPDPELLDRFLRWARKRVAKRYRSYYREDGELKRWPLNRHVPEEWGVFTSAFNPLHPDHGLTLTGGQNAAGYVAKMGLTREVSSFMGKVGRGGSRTPFQVLLDWHVGGNPADARVWREYAAATHGMSRWHWTPGLRADLLGEERKKTEDELLEEEWERTAERAVCFEIGADLWRALRSRIEGSVGYYLIEAYNAGGLDGLRSFVASQWRGGGGDPPRIGLDRERRFLWLVNRGGTPWS